MFEKEAEEIANRRCHEIMCFGHCSFSSPKHHRCGEWHREYNCAKEGAESREKQIQIDAEQIRALQKQNGELTDKVKELEAQIEKMKCCPTCDNNKEEHTPEEHYRCKTCKKFCNWELAD